MLETKTIISSRIIDPRNYYNEKQTLETLSSQNWDIFTIPEVLIKELKKLGILEPQDSQKNLVISLSYAPEDKSDFYNTINQKSRTGFFKITEQRGINHTLYRTENGELVFVMNLQEAIIDKMARFTGCYLDQKINGQLYGITTNAYPLNMLDKKILGVEDTIPEQQIVLARFNNITRIFEDVMAVDSPIILQDPNNYYYPIHFEWRDPNVYNIVDNKAEFVFCARDIDGKACVGRGVLDIGNYNQNPIMIATKPLDLEYSEDVSYLECPQIFFDKGQKWLLASVGLKNGTHYQGCWVRKNKKWIMANGDGKFNTGYPQGYESYSGKFTSIDGKPYFICWNADSYGLPSSILPPVPVSFDFENSTCSLASVPPPIVLDHQPIRIKPPEPKF
jgi:hypothetical protein